MFLEIISIFLIFAGIILIAVIIAGLIIPSAVLKGPNSSRRAVIQMYLFWALFCIFGGLCINSINEQNFSTALLYGALTAVFLMIGFIFIINSKKLKTESTINQPIVREYKPVESKQVDTPKQFIIPERKPSEEISTPPRTFVNSQNDAVVETMPVVENIRVPESLAKIPLASDNGKGAPEIQLPEKETSISSWSGEGEPIQVGTHTIQNPFIYWSETDNPANDPSCIVLSLPIVDSQENKPGKLPSCPTYTSLSPEQRNIYLKWLSEGKKGEISDIDYIFLYYGGLERRSLVDKENREEIVKEVRRLLRIYHTSASLNSYGRSLIAYILGSFIENANTPKFNEYFPWLEEINSHELPLALAWFSTNKKPIPWSLAFSVAKLEPINKNTIQFKSDPDNFEKNFKSKFSLQYPRGFQIEPAKRPLKIEYRPANSSLIRQINTKEIEITQVLIDNPLGKKKQFDPIFAIWKECNQDLDQESPLSSQNPIELTPKLVKDTVAVKTDTRKGWDDFFASKEPEVEENYIVTFISEICEMLKTNTKGSIGNEDFQKILNSANAAGYNIVPDNKLKEPPFSQQEPVAIIPIPDEEGEITANYYAAGFMLEVGMCISASDNEIKEVELNFINKKYSGNFRLTPFEIQCLNAFQRILSASPPSLEAVGEKIKEKLNPAKKEKMAAFLVGVAAADGLFKQSEEVALISLFEIMGIPHNKIDELILNYDVDHYRVLPITIQKQAQHTPGEPIPPENSHSGTLIPDDAQFIVDLFQTDTPDDEITGDKKAPGPELITDTNLLKCRSFFDEDTLNSLDNRFYSIIPDILSSSSFNNNEWENLAKKHHLLPNDVFNSLNEWSLDQFDDHLIEEDSGKFIVNSSLCKK